MDAVYRNMHSSHPYQRDQMHYSPHFHPLTEPIPSQMHIHPARPPVNHGCWPWVSNYGYVPPITCHGCFNHGYMPSHYPCGSPYSHVSPPYCPVNYPPPFPAQYVPHPSFYGTEQPRYEYERNAAMGGQHCCACTNHSPHRKEEKNVRIEAEEPDGERRKNNSILPLQFKNEPYPIVWFPPDYSDKKDGNKAYENGTDVEKQPTLSKGWYPFYLSDLVSSGAEETKHEEDDDGGKGRFPLPFFWIPYKPEEKEMEKQEVNDSNTKPRLESEQGKKNVDLIGEDIGGQAASREKDVPLKKVDKHEDTQSFKNQERERDVKDRVDNGEKKVDNGGSKLSKECVKRKASPSPPKSSKLPPVCLRVDSLPKRKTASRSPSPPGDNVNSNKFKESRGLKTIEVLDGKTWQEKNMDVNVQTPIKQLEEKREQGNISGECTKTYVMKGQSEEGEIHGDKAGKTDEAKETSKGKLSEEEAAVVIQSAYRGFDVRRWEPLKKLKEIARVQEQIANVKKMIQEFESSSDIHDIGKQRNIISETIMSLLLKLDTIQGLHPSIREVRKSVVKELVSLQEKLDTLKDKKSGNSPEQDSISTSVVMPSQNGNETPSDIPEADQNQLDGSFIICENLENSEAVEKLEKQTVKNEDGKCNEVFENVEKSTSRDDCEDPVLGQSNILSDSQNAVKDCDERDSELADLPIGAFDDIYAQESTNNNEVFDADIREACLDEQLHEGSIEVPMSANVAPDEENKEHADIHEKSDISRGEVKESSEAQGASPIDGEFEKQVDIKTRGEYEDQQPENTYSGIVQLSEAPVDEGKEMSCQQLQEGNLEQEKSGADTITADGDNDVTSSQEVDPVKDDLTESNKKLVEENERLRVIMENLIKSGQEQLTAISSLTGRVKDLERKLSKKKKLKVKQQKSNKMRSLVPDDDE